MILQALIYNVACDRCPLFHAPGAYSPDAAQEEAQDAGWIVGDVVLCPECVAAMAKPRLRLRGTA